MEHTLASKGHLLYICKSWVWWWKSRESGEWNKRKSSIFGLPAEGRWPFSCWRWDENDLPFYLLASFLWLEKHCLRTIRIHFFISGRGQKETWSCGWECFLLWSIHIFKSLHTHWKPSIVVKSILSGVRLPGFKSSLYHLLALPTGKVT